MDCLRGRMLRIGSGALLDSIFAAVEDVTDIFLGTLLPRLRGFRTMRVFNISSLSVWSCYLVPAG